MQNLISGYGSLTWTKGLDRIMSYINEVELIQEEFEGTKGVIRIRLSKKNKQHNGQKEKCKKTNNDLQYIHIKLQIE
jgi:hypothetical protein